VSPGSATTGFGILFICLIKSSFCDSLSLKFTRFIVISSINFLNVLSSDDGLPNFVNSVMKIEGDENYRLQRNASCDGGH
jgi:hypothetical protein